MRYINLIVLLGLFGLFTAPAVHAGKLYRWVDAQGNVSYQDRPPPEGTGQVEVKNLGGGSSAAGSGSAEGKKAPVILYAIPKCSPCDQARAYLQKRKVPFKEINVSDNLELQKEMREKVGDLSVPTLVVGSKVMKGYMESLLEGELDDAGYPKLAETEGEEEDGAQ